MSNRKETLKKSLGISEYPWSSDDDENDNAQPMSGFHLFGHLSGESRPSVADLPGTSAPAPPVSSPLSTARRNQARQDRDLFWSIINNTNRVPSVTKPTRSSSRSYVPLSLVSRPRGVHAPPPPADARAGAGAGAGGGGPSAELQRVLAFRKLNRNLNALRSTKSATNFYAVSRHSPTLPVSTIFSPSSASLATDITAIIKAKTRRAQGRGAALEPSRSAPTLSDAYAEEPLASSVGCPRSRPAPAAADASAGAERAPPAAGQSDDEAGVHATSLMSSVLSPPAVRLENNAEIEDAEASHNTSGVSLEEEVLEIDAEPEEPAAPPAGGAGDGGHEETANITATGEEGDQSPHGVKRKRETSEEGGEPNTVKEFNQNLLRLLECPVCLEWMEPPMSQCRRGHLVCGRCRARLASCPVCRTAFSSVRNRAMEGVAEMLRYPCRHGCGREVRLRRRAPHEASCGARRYRCVAPACADRAPLPHRDLAHHFQSKHLSMLKIGKKHKFSLKMNAEQHDNWLIMAMHELFHLRVDVDIRTWGVVVYVAYIGPKCNAANFTYEVCVVGAHNSRRLTYARAAHCDLESSSLNVSRQDCFHLTLDQALNFLRVKNRHCEPDKFLNFSVEIAKSEVDSKHDSDS